MKPGTRAWTKAESEILASDISTDKGIPLPNDPKLREAEIDRMARETLPKRSMTPWMNGLLARQGDEPVETNPYPKKTGCWWAWRAGWYFVP